MTPIPVKWITAIAIIATLLLGLKHYAERRLSQNPPFTQLKIVSPGDGTLECMRVMHRGVWYDLPTPVPVQIKKGVAFMIDAKALTVTLTEAITAHETSKKLPVPKRR